MMLVVPFGFLVAAYMYNRLSVQEIDLNKIFAGIMLSLMQFIIVFYLVGIVSIFLRIMFGASVEELSTASDNVLCVNAVLAYAATLLLGFRFASQRSRTSDAASVTAKSATNLMRNTIIAMIMMLIATTVVFLIIFL